MIYAVAIWLVLILAWGYWPEITNYCRTWRWRRLKRRIDTIRSDHR
jgi:peptidoglycan/LPS O-acetylase OafA/YrhL